MGLLKFTLLGIDNLAWPAIALGYPLFASIRAVGTDSKYHMRKLVMYWIVFSLLTLFEFAFAKIIVWIPYWSSVRFAVIFWSVIPEFEGACLVTPALLLKLQQVIGLYHKLKEERLSKTEKISDVVEKHAIENGSEALEKPIASKKHHKIDFQRKTNTVEAEGENTAETLNQVRHEQSISLPCAKGMTPIPEASMENRCPQQEWRCDLCKVNARSEKSLINHLLGRKHKSKFNQSLKVNEIKIRDGEQWCIVCDVKLPSTVDAASSHFKGKLTLVKY